MRFACQAKLAGNGERRYRMISGDHASRDTGLAAGTYGILHPWPQGINHSHKSQKGQMGGFRRCVGRIECARQSPFGQGQHSVTLPTHRFRQAMHLFHPFGRLVWV